MRSNLHRISRRDTPMNALYILIPLSLVLVFIAVAIFIWAVNNGQFDDLDSPAWRILEDDDEIQSHDPPT